MCVAPTEIMQESQMMSVLEAYDSYYIAILAVLFC